MRRRNKALKNKNANWMIQRICKKIALKVCMRSSLRLFLVLGAVPLSETPSARVKQPAILMSRAKEAANRCYQLISHVTVAVVSTEIFLTLGDAIAGTRKWITRRTLRGFQT